MPPSFPFITDAVERFNDLNNVPTTILEALVYPLRITNIIICNKGAGDMRINLQINTTIPNIDPTHLISDLLIKGYNTMGSEKYNTIDLIKEVIGSDLKLPEINDSLICFSNGPTQVFDCTIIYYTLNELTFFE